MLGFHLPHFLLGLPLVLRMLALEIGRRPRRVAAPLTLAGAAIPASTPASNAEPTASRNVVDLPGSVNVFMPCAFD